MHCASIRYNMVTLGSGLRNLRMGHSKTKENLTPVCVADNSHRKLSNWFTHVLTAPRWTYSCPHSYCSNLPMSSQLPEELTHVLTAQFIAFIGTVRFSVTHPFCLNAAFGGHALKGPILAGGGGAICVKTVHRLQLSVLGSQKWNDHNTSNIGINVTKAEWQCAWKKNSERLRFLHVGGNPVPFCTYT